MLHNITFEKVEEIIRMIEHAREAAPDDRADDPHRGGPFGSQGIRRPAPPTEPQPAPDWPHAVERYLSDLPDAALGEVIGLYRYGRGDAANAQDAVTKAVAEVASAARPHAERVAFLISQDDLADSLRHALERL